MMAKLPLFLVLGMATSLAAPGLSRAPRPIPAATPAGKPVNCVQISRIRETRVRDDKTIDFFLVGNHVYRNTLPYSCPELGFERAFSYQTSQTELCSVDIITVFRQGEGVRRGASCGLGSFQPVTGVR